MITPLDIESKEFKKSPFGYNVTEVDEFLNEIIIDYESLYKDNIDLKDKISMLNEGIQYYKNLEKTIQSTLVLAEKTAEETKASACNMGEQIIKDAEIKGDKIIQDANQEVFKISQKLEELNHNYNTAMIKYKNFLSTQLEILNGNHIEELKDENKKDENSNEY